MLDNKNEVAYHRNTNIKPVAEINLTKNNVFWKKFKKKKLFFYSYGEKIFVNIYKLWSFYHNISR